MTAHSDTPQATGPFWFGKTEAEIRNAVDCRAERWFGVPGFGRYQWSDKGRTRSVDCVVNGRAYRGQVLKHRLDRYGYEIVNVRNDEGRQVTVPVAKMVLLAHHPAFRSLAAFPEGLQTRHNPVTGQQFNCYPEGLWPGTKLENEADKDAPPEPQFNCRNFVTCGNMVFHEGRRCVPCTEAVGREAAQLLGRGANLLAVAEHFGYSGPDWVWQLAVKHGGLDQGELSKAAALAQHPGMVQRVRLRRAGLGRGDTP